MTHYHYMPETKAKPTGAIYEQQWGLSQDELEKVNALIAVLKSTIGKGHNEKQPRPNRPSKQRQLLDDVRVKLDNILTDDVRQINNESFDSLQQFAELKDSISSVVFVERDQLIVMKELFEACLEAIE